MPILNLKGKEGNSLARLSLLFSLYKYTILAVCFVAICLFFISIPFMYAEIKKNCINQSCMEVGAVPPTLSGLHAIGWNENIYAAYYTGLYSIFGLAFLGAALLLWIKKPNDRISLFSILTLCTFGITFTEITRVLDGQLLIIYSLNRLLDLTGIICIVLYFFLFPNGRFVPKWSAMIALLLLLPRAFETLFPSFGWSLNDSPWMIGIWLLIWLISQLTTQIYRYRSVSSHMERQQTKWVIYGLAVTVIGFLSVGVIPVLVDERYITQGGPIKFAIMNMCIYMVFLAIPITITYSILRKRLWDIDLILKRTFVYGVLFLFIVSVYIFVVWYLSYLFQQQGNLIFSLIATTVVALSFGPIKEKLLRIANRYLFGERESPYMALEKLSTQLEKSYNPEQTIEVILKTIKESMRLPFVSITVNQISNQDFYAASGAKQEEVYTYPLHYLGEDLGALSISPRFFKERFSSADQKLLNILIRQATVIIHSVKNGLEVVTLNESLKESRERLVLAREEERRRLRRNLHDDLAPRLAALALNAGTIEEMIEENPKKAVVLLSEVRQVIRKTVSDIRVLVHDLRPPALDELGLVHAIQERINDLMQINKVQKERIQFHFTFPKKVPALPAAVEVAAFRILTEALVNVVKHSNATECFISIHIHETENTIELGVTDNGVGINISQSLLKKGIGLHSMRERAHELGGYWKIEGHEKGTMVFASLPLSEKI